MQTTFIEFSTRTIANLSEVGENLYELNRISVPSSAQGRGHGRRVMGEVLAAADAVGVALRLQINPYGALGYEDLCAWYQRCGFRWDGQWWMRPPHTGLHPEGASRQASVTSKA